MCATQIKENECIHHSLQKRKVICSRFFFGSSPELDAGDAMLKVSNDTQNQTCLILLLLHCFVIVILKVASILLEFTSWSCDGFR